MPDRTSSAANTPARQAFKDCLRLREFAGRQTLTRKDNADLERIADRLHALAALHGKEQPSASWTCRHGTTYTGSVEFIGGARNAHDEIAGWMQPSSDGPRSTNDIAQEIIEAAPQVEALVEEWFAVESAARVRMLEAQARG